MKIAPIFMSAAFCLWILSPISISTPTASAMANEPCQSHKYSNSFSYVECKNIFLQPGMELPINLSPDNIVSIVFRNSILPAIPDGSFTSFTKLAELYLNRNGLKSIVPGVFNGLAQLQLLHLQDNSIMKIPTGTFTSLTNLEILDVSRNAIISLGRGCFTGLMNLKFLNLSRNTLYFLDSDTFLFLITLEILDLSHNYLFMSELNFTLNVRTPYLEKLLVNNNLLRHFSVSSVENLNRLELLDVSFNTLTEIDFGTFIVPKFGNFSNNQISTIKGWSDVYQSNLMDFSRNKINSSKRIIGDTKKFYLRENEIETLDSFTFVNSGEIIHLDLSYNLINDIANDTFQGLSYLETLYLNNNQIGYLLMGCFTDLDSLKLLSLTENSLTYLENGVFTGLSQLTNLYLDNNRLSTITEKTFYGLNKLENLYLNHNLLGAVDVPTLLKQLPKLKAIYLKNNQWECGELLELTKKLQIHSVKVPGGDDFDTTQGFEFACDKYNLKVTTHSSRNKIFTQVLHEMCLHFMLFIVIALDFLVFTWYFFHVRVTIRHTYARIRKIKIYIEPVRRR